MPKQHKLLHYIVALALVGAAISVYSLLHKSGVASGTFCTINDTFSCDIVNQSKYSSIAGIPVSLLGVLGYLFMAVAAFMKIRQPADKGLTKFLVAASFGALLFSFYLTSIEAFVLHAWCMLCLGSQVVILGISVLAAIVFRNEQK